MVANFQVSELGFWRGEWSSGETNYMFKNMLNAMILFLKKSATDARSKWDLRSNFEQEKK